MKSNNKRGSSGRFFTGLRYLNSKLQRMRAFSLESSALFPLPLFRFASHGLVLSLALIVVIATPPQVSPNAPQKNLNADGASSASSKAPGERSLPTAEPDYLRATPLLTTDYTDPQQVAKGVSYPKTRQTVESYTVQSGDNLSSIATRYGITTMTLVWANDIKNADSLKPGAELKIPPTSGVLHEVKSGETLMGIAQKYQADVEEITGYTPNKIANPNALVLGQAIMIPGAEKPPDPPPARLAATEAPIGASAPAAVPAPAPAQASGSGLFQWPTFGQLSQGFTAGHRGLDIAQGYGVPVYAAEAGVVAWVQYDTYGYGYHLLINHGNGYQTLYAHFSDIYVVPGQSVARGEGIGRQGTTGYTTGPHLHFEVHKNGVPINPLLMLLPR